MAKPSTVDIVGDLLRHVAPRVRAIPDVAGLRDILPYRTVVVQDETGEMSVGLSKEFTEHRLYVMDGPVRISTIDLAFHCELGLVNYSFFVIPRELFKRKAVMKAVRVVVFPYLLARYPGAPIVPQTQDIYLFPHDESGITFQVRAYVSTPRMCGVGVAMIDSNFVS